jgi:hypothetical protein
MARQKEACLSAERETKISPQIRLIVQHVRCAQIHHAVKPPPIAFVAWPRRRVWLRSCIGEKRFAAKSPKAGISDLLNAF